MLIEPTKLRALTDEKLAGIIQAVMIVIRGLTFGETREEFTQAVESIGHYTQDQYEAMLDQLCGERQRRRIPAWTPFYRAQVPIEQFFSAEADERFRVLAEKTGVTLEEMRETYLSTMNDEMYLNSRYQVALRRSLADDGEGGTVEMVHISVKGLVPGHYMHDWRDLQKIKTELLGPNCEAVELYPAEERLIDTADQWHLWGVNSGTFRWPVGWNQGRITLDPEDTPRSGTASQRAFD